MLMCHLICGLVCNVYFKVFRKFTLHLILQAYKSTINAIATSPKIFD